MNQLNKLKNLEGLSYFDKNTLSQFFDLKDNSLYTNIKRWLKAGKLIQIKRGLYVTQDYFKSLKDKEGYVEFLANRIHQPSYLSTEYILQKHNILTEAVYAITSISLKSKRIYRNKITTFIYQNIKDNLFTGYNIIKRGPFEILEATKAKALFDYLYLQLLKTKEIDQELLLSYRLNLEELKSKDLREFARYCKLSKMKKYLTLPKLLENIRDH
ncbi:MAG: hypothetical protein HYS07_09535 [Chlamydiae bacterium]|nr:hypothetical protein [Chlamydiota bacterium]MBI3277079.1 hypothetical protein [Chlamydiota bacterium]